MPAYPTLIMDGPDLADEIEAAIRWRRWAWVASMLEEGSRFYAAPTEAIWVGAELARRGLILRPDGERPGLWWVVREAL